MWGRTTSGRSVVVVERVTLAAVHDEGFRMVRVRLDGLVWRRWERRVRTWPMTMGPAPRIMMDLRSVRFWEAALPLAYLRNGGSVSSASARHNSGRRAHSSSTPFPWA